MAPLLAPEAAARPQTEPYQDPWKQPDGLDIAASTSGKKLYGYSLWRFDGAAWRLAKDMSAEGGRAAGPPSAPGRFRGQVRAILSVSVADRDDEPAAAR
jgi:hypothetical protein